MSRGPNWLLVCGCLAVISFAWGYVAVDLVHQWRSRR